MTPDRLRAYLLMLGFPVDTVTIGDPNDSLTWNVTCLPGTPAAVATKTLAVARSTPLAVIDRQQAISASRVDFLRALCATLLWQRLGTQPTPAQFTAEWDTFRDRFVAAHRALNG